MENRFETGAPDSSVIDQEIKEVSVANFSGHTAPTICLRQAGFCPQCNCKWLPVYQTYVKLKVKRPKKSCKSDKY